MAGTLLPFDRRKPTISLERSQKALENIRKVYEKPGETLSIITPDRYQESRDVLKKHFLTDEPLSIAFDMQYEDLLAKDIDEALHSNLSVCMTSSDSGEMRGVILNTMIRKAETPTNHIPENSTVALVSRFLEQKE